MLDSRGEFTAVPSHVQASPWAMNLPQASKPDWPVPLAQLHKTYLLCQDSQGLVVVDQHAAHERVLYERQLKAWAGRAVRTQHLLLPQRMNVSPAQAVQLNQWAPQLAELGLEIQDVGGGLFFVSSLPEFLKQLQVAPLLLDLLEHPDGFSQPASGDPAEVFRREAAAQLACKAAIKANATPLTLGGHAAAHGRPFRLRNSLVLPRLMARPPLGPHQFGRSWKKAFFETVKGLG